MTARHYIKYLELLPHPEGGYYKESYRSSGILPASCLPAFRGNRSFSTAIYFLLEQGDFSAFHRIKSDECWHFYKGGTLLIHVLQQNGEYICKRLGKNLKEGEALQFVVPAGAWFASEPVVGTSFALVGCTVAPGFHFEDFEMAREDDLLQLYPKHEALIKRLCR